MLLCSTANGVLRAYIEGCEKYTIMFLLSMWRTCPMMTDLLNPNTDFIIKKTLELPKNRVSGFKMAELIWL